MLPLALNTMLPRSLKAKHQFAIAILPMGLMFGSFVPTLLFADWLERALGIPHDSPVRSHPNGVIWLLVFLSMAVSLMVLGYLLGWLANGLISRFVLGWPTSKVLAVYLHSEVPPEWLKNSSAQIATLGKSGSAQGKWETQRAGGPVRFIVIRGVLGWGTGMFLLMYVLPATSRGAGLAIPTVVSQAALWGGVGAAFGAVIWFLSQWNHRKQRARDEP